MITVAIFINGSPIYTRSAVRVSGEPGKICTYKSDDGCLIKHNYDDGAIKLANKMLRRIKEV